MDANEARCSTGSPKPVVIWRSTPSAPEGTVHEKVIDELSDATTAEAPVGTGTVVGKVMTTPSAQLE